MTEPHRDPRTEAEEEAARREASRRMMNYLLLSLGLGVAGVIVWGLAQNLLIILRA